MWIQTGVTIRKRLSWVMTSVTLTCDLWSWLFAWSSLLSLVITPENFMMIRWEEHREKDVTDRQTDGRAERGVLRAAWSQLKTRFNQTAIEVMRWVTKHITYTRIDIVFYPYLNGSRLVKGSHSEWVNKSIPYDIWILLFIHVISVVSPSQRKGPRWLALSVSNGSCR